MKTPKTKHEKDSMKKRLETEFGWVFASSSDILHEDPHDEAYGELLKRNYKYDDKLYHWPKEIFGT